MIKKLLLICTLTFISVVVAKAFSSTISDSRQVYFYIWEAPTELKVRVRKIWRNKADSLRVARIDLICESDDHTIDTIPCIYTRNSIYFNAIDTIQHKLVNMSLSFEVKPEKGSSGPNEKLTVPFLVFFMHSSATSPLSFAFQRKEGSHFDVNMSKTDYPFIALSQKIESASLAE
ncbi:hypothetical protein SAMN05428949_7399 [Chitinophaga sp. YR627]|nr:hypothetical protein SAMN05428949_7399 [Chitinophaga sp. YR627]